MARLLRKCRHCIRQATDAERPQYWERATKLYRGFAAYAQRTRSRQIPIMVLTPKRTG